MSIIKIKILIYNIKHKYLYFTRLVVVHCNCIQHRNLFHSFIVYSESLTIVANHSKTSHFTLLRFQLLIISKTDILIGMHGAGLTYAVLMEQGSGLLELVPNYWSPSLLHFEKIAISRDINYIRWYNEDEQLELSNRFVG